LLPLARNGDKKRITLRLLNFIYLAINKRAKLGAYRQQGKSIHGHALSSDFFLLPPSERKAFRPTGAASFDTRQSRR
jgi:hypothetical protein